MHHDLVKERKQGAHIVTQTCNVLGNRFRVLSTFSKRIGKCLIFKQDGWSFCRRRDIGYDIVPSRSHGGIGIIQVDRLNIFIHINRQHVTCSALLEHTALNSRAHLH